MRDHAATPVVLELRVHGDYQRTLVYLDELEKAVAASLSDGGPYPG